MAHTGLVQRGVLAQQRGNALDAPSIHHCSDRCPVDASPTAAGLAERISRGLCVANWLQSIGTGPSSAIRRRVAVCLRRRWRSSRDINHACRWRRRLRRRLNRLIGQALTHSILDAAHGVDPAARFRALHTFVLVALRVPLASRAGWRSALGRPADTRRDVLTDGAVTATNKVA